MPGHRPMRHNGSKTHCANGHPLNGYNLRLKQRAGYVERVCRECRNYQERTRRSGQRRRARS